MKYLLKYCFPFFASMLFSRVNAQAADSVEEWSIQDCFQYAMEHNIQINTTRLNEQIAVQDLSAAHGLKIPSLSASATNAFNNANNLFGNNNQLVNQLTTSGNYSFNSTITLWNGNYVNNNIKQKDLLNQSAGLSVTQSQNAVILLITQAYLNILLAKENLKFIEDLVSTSAAKVKQGQLLYDAGSIAKKDLLQLQAQLASDKFLRVQTQNAIRQNILALKQILQLPTDTTFDIRTPATIEVAGLLPPLDNVQQTALQIFPEIKIGKLGTDIAELDIAKVRAGSKPVLTATGGIGTGYITAITNPVPPKTTYFKQVENNFYQRIALTLLIPIFSNRVNTTNLEKANIAFKQADLNFKNEQLVLSQAVEQAYLNASNAQQSFNAANEQLLAAAESYRIVNEQFKLGAINTYDLFQVRNQYVQAEQAFTQAKYTAVLQQKIYEFYMGTPITL